MMDKLSLHESLRIVIPGILLCAILYVMHNEALEDIGVVVIPAVFAGFALNSFLHRVGNGLFRMIAHRSQISIDGRTCKFSEHWKIIIKAKLLVAPAPADASLSEGLTRSRAKAIGYAFFSKSYTSGELSIFRVPKSLALMCFNLATTALLAPLIYMIYAFVLDGYIRTFHYNILLLCSILAATLIISAYKFTVDTLVNELHFWNGITEKEVEHLAYIIRTLNETAGVQNSFPGAPSTSKLNA